MNWTQESKRVWCHPSGARVVYDSNGWSGESRRFCQRPWAARDPDGNLLRNARGQVRTFEIFERAQQAVEIAMKATATNA